MDKSRITWTDSTWNPWMGCQKVSGACKYCYMHKILDKDGNDPSIVNRTKSSFYKPLNWKVGRLIFTCSMSDFFIKEADEWRKEAWDIIKRTPQHTYLILTKRPERIQECLPEDWSPELYSHVWLGTTVESQNEVHRIHELAKIKCQLRWVSFEPLLGPIYLNKEELDTVEWAVIGGESGNLEGKYRFRKSELAWYLSLMYQFRDAGTPVFFKQLGSYYHHYDLKVSDSKGERWCSKFPDVFKIRQYPSIEKGGYHGI
ncbi:DUF5131 family protein [Croceivirga sp. JEA036]|uniref:DUF5131 family protein n=1 Tax=Croceivirga sp. JEA036 TaxID=2721162 RepID=UPI00143AA912|nr:DUF5131 family protein [Croceivirga sp. JEA036]NJB35309.1 DUF5131 family protein [Croceivirga sp. JEA036]